MATTIDKTLPALSVVTSVAATDLFYVVTVDGTVNGKITGANIGKIKAANSTDATLVYNSADAIRVRSGIDANGNGYIGVQQSDQAGNPRAFNGMAYDPTGYAGFVAWSDCRIYVDHATAPFARYFLFEDDGLIEWHEQMTACSITQQPRATDNGPEGIAIKGQPAYPAATVNVTGGPVSIVGGVGATVGGVSGNVYLGSAYAGTEGLVVLCHNGSQPKGKLAVAGVLGAGAMNNAGFTEPLGVDGAIAVYNPDGTLRGYLPIFTNYID